LTVSSIVLSALSAVFVARIDNHPLFPDVYAKNEIWFHGLGELFRRSAFRDTIGGKT
jgi:hypothetical protein